MAEKRTNLDLLGVGLLLLVALGVFLFFDLAKALSVYLQFTVAYTAFWLVVGIYFAAPHVVQVIFYPD
jgi:hypothetical protein